MEKDRREFLEKFVTLGSASLILISCGGGEAVYGPPPSHEEVAVVYGPAPVNPINLPIVIDIYYKDSDDSLQSINGKTDLPLNLTIVVLFSENMDGDSKNAIEIYNNIGNLLSFESSWITEDRIEIILSDSVLEYDTQYTIYIGDAMDKEGNIIDYTQSNFLVRFKTKKIP